eukprot:6497045-Pyramimonas_sp.AAC.1
MHNVRVLHSVSPGMSYSAHNAVTIGTRARHSAALMLLDSFGKLACGFLTSGMNIFNPNDPPRHPQTYGTACSDNYVFILRRIAVTCAEGAYRAAFNLEGVLRHHGACGAGGRGANPTE